MEQSAPDIENAQSEYERTFNAPTPCSHGDPAQCPRATCSLVGADDVYQYVQVVTAIPAADFNNDTHQQLISLVVGVFEPTEKSTFFNIFCADDRRLFVVPGSAMPNPKHNGFEGFTKCVLKNIETSTNAGYEFDAPSVEFRICDGKYYRWHDIRSITIKFARDT